MVHDCFHSREDDHLPDRRYHLFLLDRGGTSRLGFNKWQNWNCIVLGLTLVLHLTELVCFGREWASVMRSLRRQFRQTTQRAQFGTWPSLLTGSGIYLLPGCSMLLLLLVLLCLLHSAALCSRAQSHCLLSILPWVIILGCLFNPCDGGVGWGGVIYSLWCLDSLLSGKKWCSANFANNCAQ